MNPLQSNKRWVRRLTIVVGMPLMLIILIPMLIIDVLERTLCHQVSFKRSVKLAWRETKRFAADLKLCWRYDGQVRL